MNDTSISDDTIISLLFDRNESALEQISKKYSSLYMSVIRQAVGNDSDAEECANDLLISIWNSIPPNRPSYLRAYVCKLARNIGIKRHRYNTRQKRNNGYTVCLSELEDYLPCNEQQLIEQSRRISTVISDFLRDIDAETRVLFIRRYFCLEPIGSLAERFEMNESAVSTKLWRARKKLKKILDKEDLE
ncbi:MAG: sigma-70 family RNA polymerase sigma factor [Clostridia bacterium]|nr:sigma-70 family RNA polymerase sigma factor [Clostridia bacterium]